MSEPVCPFASTGPNLSLHEYMKKYLILRPPLDPRYFAPDEDSPLFQVDTTPDIILHRYVEDSQLPSSLHQPPPCSQGMFCSQMFKQVHNRSLLENCTQSSVHSRSPMMPSQPSIFDQSSLFLEPDDEGLSDILSEVAQHNLSDIESEVEQHNLSDIESESNLETQEEAPLSISVRNESTQSTSSPSSSSLTETSDSTDTDSQTVETDTKSVNEASKIFEFNERTLRKKDFLVATNIQKFQNAWKRNRENTKKRNAEDESPELIIPKRAKSSKFSPDKVRPLSKTLPVIAKDSGETKPVFKKPLSLASKPWTEHEMECLVVGVNRYGNKWQEIHDAFNFHPSRTLNAMQTKLRKMKSQGLFRKYLRKFKKKAGYTDLTLSDTGGESPMESIDSRHFPPQPINSESIFSPSQSISDDISPSISFSPTISPNNDKFKFEFPPLWSQKEINELEEGHKQFGPQWKIILETYKINRSARALQRKFSILHPSYERRPVDRGATSSTTPKYSPITSPRPKRDIRRKASIQTTNNIVVVWTDKELQYVRDGFKKFGPRWKIILDYYDFHPYRTTGMLRKMYRVMHPDYERWTMK